MNRQQQKKLSELINLGNKLSQQLIAQSQSQPQEIPVYATKVAVKSRRIVVAPKAKKDQFNYYFYFASFVILFMKLTDISELGWQAPFAPLIFLGIIKFFSHEKD